MGPAWLWLFAERLVICAILVAFVPMGLRAQSADDVRALGRQVVQLYDQGKYAEATPIAEQAVALAERVVGYEHPDTLSSLHNLAGLYKAVGRYGEAEVLYRRALTARERVLGREHPETLQSLNNLAELYLTVGRYAKAEPLMKRALAASERVLGPEHPDTLTSLNNLAELYKAQGRYEESVPLLKQALAASERVLGNEHPDTLRSLDNLAQAYQALTKSGEAGPLFERALEAFGRVLGPEHPDTLITLNNLATLYQAQGRYKEAERLFKRALQVRERVLGREHPDTLSSLHNLAELYQTEGRYREAEPLLKRALEARERVLGHEHPDTLTSQNDLAELHFARGDWVGAAQYWRRSTAGILARVRGEGDVDQTSQFWGLIKTLYRLAPKGASPAVKALREAFELAQWEQGWNSAAASLEQMAARGAAGDAGLSLLARARQDLVAEFRAREAQRNLALGQAPEKRNAKEEAETLARLAVIAALIGGIDKSIKDNFPDYAALVSPAPLSVEEVQTQLRLDEALVLFLGTNELKPAPEETFIWVVTKTDMRWVRSDLGTSLLTREVEALRCGLDAEAWAGPLCGTLSGQSYTMFDRYAGKPLPFDHARAFKLYQALLGQVEDLIKGKRLLIVPSGPLTQLPFQVLVTAPPHGHDNKAAAWLVRDHSLTILPAVSSLKALRRLSLPSAATKPLIGFGNPLLDGPTSSYASLAELARGNKTCTAISKAQVASAVSPGVAQVETRSGLADVAFLRKQAPLPETADELCAVARDLHADVSDIYLGARATEREVKALSASGQLARYRIVHFATHGALAGQVSTNAEPGLLLTPPATPSEEDDGYLSASEVAALKLDADWVILSACNTAAGGEREAEALSGLARAFIYAQARALLVSHWAVNSDATVKLVTGAVGRLAANRSMGRAEAVRQAMLALIDKGGPQEAHPAYWAPFVVVGEGGAER